MMFVVEVVFYCVLILSMSSCKDRRESYFYTTNDIIVSTCSVTPPLPEATPKPPKHPKKEK